MATGNQPSTSIAPQQLPGNPGSAYPGLPKINDALLPLLGVWFVSATFLGVMQGTWPAVMLWSMSCLSVGGLLGFLFGIPRMLSPAERSALQNNPSAPGGGASSAAFWKANTNLEEVSDWLTKIIVGLSLANLPAIEERLRSVSKLAAASIMRAEAPSAGLATAAHAAASAASSTASMASGASSANAAASAASASAAASAASAVQACGSLCPPSEAAVSVAMALIVGLTILGFLMSYLYTRIVVPGAFVQSETAFARTLREEQANTTRVAPAPPGAPVAMSASDVMAAERVAVAAQADRPDLPLRALTDLAREYEQVRATLPFGDYRTGKMTDIVNRMKPLTLASRGALDMLMKSPLAGERLAATIILMTIFDARHIEWLADRFHEESAFIGFQAASVLLARLSKAAADERKRIIGAVARAKARIAPDRREAQRDNLINLILKEAGPPDTA